MTAMGRPLWIALIGLVFLTAVNAPVLAQPDLYGFLSGSYVVIGKHPDSTETYSGQMNLEECDGQLQVVRIVNGHITRGIGTIEKAAGGDATVLRIRFDRDGKSYEGTYLVDGDLDNYARLTGYVYLADGSTRRVGLEALFADRGQLVHD